MGVHHPGHHRFGIGCIKRAHVLHVADGRADGEVRQGRILGGGAGDVPCLRLGVIDQILAQADVDRLGPTIKPPRQHHVDHPRLADQVGHADRCATAGEQPALAFGQAEIGVRPRHPDMRRAGQLQAATDDRAFQHGDDRHPAVFHLVERLVPAQAQVHEVAGIAVFAVMFHQIQAGAEMITVRPQDRRPHACAWQDGEDVDQLLDRGGIQRVALGGTVQRDGGDLVVVHLQQDVFQFQIRDAAHVRVSSLKVTCRG